MVIRILLLLLLIDDLAFCHNHVHVSAHGRDAFRCGGANNPCGTLQYAIQNVSRQGDSLVLYGGAFGTQTLEYFVTESIGVSTNLYIEGKSDENVPIIKPSPESLIENIFVIGQQSEGYHHEFVLQNLRFENASIAKLNYHCSIRMQSVSANSNGSSRMKILNGGELFQLNVDIEIDNCQFFGYQHIILMEAFSELTVKLVNVNAEGAMSNRDVAASTALLIKESNSMPLIFISLDSSNFSRFDSTLHLSVAQLDRKQVRNQVSISNCHFINYERRKIPVTNATVFIRGELNFNIDDSIFIGNSGLQAGAIHLLKVSGSVLIDKCTFQNNSAIWQGGALCLVDNARNVSVTNCLFENNIVLDDSMGNGGAIDNRGNLFIDKCIFMNNSAHMMGGTIQHSRFWSSANTYGLLTLINSYLKSARGTSTHIGKLLHSSSDVYVYNVTFQETFAAKQINAALHHDNRFLKVGGNITFQCPVNHVLHTYKQYQYPNKSGNSYAFWEYFCDLCPSRSYSVEKSMEKIIDEKQNYMHSITCFQCPTGGKVTHSLISIDNFWGKEETTGEVRFYYCPAKYCCANDSNPCMEYNTCNVHREGHLCGSCKHGYSEQFASSACIKSSDCSATVFWIIFCVLGMFHVIFILYLKKIIKCFRKIGKVFITESSKDKFDNSTEHYVPIKTSDWDTKDYEEITRRKKKNSFVSGFVKIIFFFYQIEYTMRVPTSLKESHQHIIPFKDFLLSVFNVDIESGKYWFLVCPYVNMTALGKIFIKIGYTFFLFFILLTLYAAVRLFKRLKDGKTIWVYVQQYDSVDQDNVPVKSNSPFQFQLTCCFIQLILLTYTSLARNTLQLINCVKIKNELRLFSYGDYLCYTKWQYAALTFFIVWITPFAFSVYVSKYLIRNCMVTLKQFLWMFACPPLVPFYYISWRNSRVKPHLSKEQVFTMKGVVEVFEEPFVKASWECVLIMRRYVIIVISILVHEPLLKLYIILLPLLLSVVHHVYTWPYNSKCLNWLETCSLVSLVFLGTINIYWSYIHVSNIQITPLLTTIGKMFIIIENVIIMSPVFLVMIFILLFVVKNGKNILKSCFRKKGETYKLIENE